MRPPYRGPTVTKVEETRNVRVKLIYDDHDHNHDDHDNDDDDSDDVWFWDRDVRYDIDPDLPFRWLMLHCCNRLDWDYRSTRFFLNGSLLRDTDTPCQLAVVNSDVIYATPAPSLGAPFHISAHGLRNVRDGPAAPRYATLCIRMHKERNRFLRARRTAPLLHQLNRHCFPDCTPDQVCFVYKGIKLTEDDTADGRSMVDGDVIDAFNFQSSCSLTMITGPCIKIKVQLAGMEFWVSMDSNAPLTRLIRFCGIEPSDMIRLLHNGRIVKIEKTANDYHVEDGDEIAVIPGYRGGCIDTNS